MTLAPPALSDFRARYSAYANVIDDTVTYWLADATREVDESWPITTDQGPAMMAVAAHNMLTYSVAGLSDGDIAALLSAGVTDFQSGGREGFRVSFSPAAIQQALDGNWDASKPGSEYLRLLRRNKGGPGVTAPGHIPRDAGWPYGIAWTGPVW
jgi:hypothetical protein